MTPVRTPDAPAAIGPYEQAVVHGGVAWCSGQIPLDPGGQLVTGTIGEETARALANLDAVLTAAGTTRDRVLRTTVYLREMADFPAMNEAYAAFFGAHRP